jgi:ATP-dependent protease HslVU (ClpYQ) peptidase subunit
MKTYLNISGRTEDARQLEELCDRLKQVSTREDVDHVNSLDKMTDFTLNKNKITCIIMKKTGSIFCSGNFSVLFLLQDM